MGQAKRKLGAQMMAVMGNVSLPLQGVAIPLCAWLGTDMLKMSMAKKEVDLTAMGVRWAMGLGGYGYTWSTLMDGLLAGQGPTFCGGGAELLRYVCCDHLKDDPEVGRPLDDE